MRGSAPPGFAWSGCNRRRRPPFTADQLEALAAGDDFRGVETEAAFGFRQTPFEAAIRESYCHPRYSRVLVER